MTDQNTSALSTNVDEAIRSLAEYLATPAGKERYRATYRADYEMWLEQLADADDPDFRGSAAYFRDAKGNAQLDTLAEVLQDELNFDSSVLNGTQIESTPLDGRCFLRTSNADKIEAYLREFFPSWV